MADTVTIKVTASYTNNPNPNGEVSNDDSIEEINSGDIEGSSDATGTTTERTVKSATGGKSVTRRRHKDLPQGAQFTKAKVDIKRSCGNQPDISLSAEGNVSVTAKVDGNCIVATSVSITTSDLHGEETITTTYRKCCGDS